MAIDLSGLLGERPDTGRAGRDEYEQFRKYDAVNNLIGPVGRGSGFVNNQYNSAVRDLQAGLRRGQYTQSGFNAGVANLDRQRAGAEKDAGGLSKGIAASGRGQIFDILQRARSKLLSYGTGRDQQQFDFSPFKKDILDVRDKFQSNLPRQFDQTFRGEQFFDPARATQAVGAAQGAQNLPNRALMEAIEAQKLRNSSSRNLGDEGAF